MAAFYVDGVAMSTTKGAATVKNSGGGFYVSWKGLGSNAQFDIGMLRNGSASIKISNDEFSSYLLSYYLDENDIPEEGSYYWELLGGEFSLASTTGGAYISPASSPVGATLELEYNGDVDDWQDTTTYYITFVEPVDFTTAPGTPDIKQKLDGTFRATWTEAVLSDGSTNFTYQLINISDGTIESSGLTTNSVTLSIPGYNYAFEYKVKAIYSDTSSSSGTRKVTFYPPSLSTPTLTLSSSSGSSVTLTWSATLSNTEGTIKYYIYAGSTLYSEQGSDVTSITIPESTLASWSSATTSFKVTAKASSLSNTSQGTSLSQTSGSVSFTYVPSTTNCEAPQVVSIASTNVAPGKSIQLSWSKASAGTNNAIKGYKIYRSTSASSGYSALTSNTIDVSTTSTSGSMYVDAPTTNGTTYYYKVMTVGAESGYNSGQSSAYASLKCTYSAPTAPTTVTIGGGTSAYAAASNGTVELSWSDAGAGTNNPITGYHIYQNGVYLRETTETSADVPVNATEGGAYTYTVYTLGKYSNSSASDECTVYTYGTPTAPQTVYVSDDYPDADTEVILYWEGAVGGAYNGIAGYNIHRSTEADGEYEHCYGVTTTETSGSCSVAAPAEMGSSYYYKVFTLGASGRVNSEGSTAVAVTAQTYSACVAPKEVLLNITVSTGESAELTWNGATAGINNQITGYEVEIREIASDGTYGEWGNTISTTSETLTVSPPSTPGNAYQYRVRVCASASAFPYSEWTISSATLLRDYTPCGAPGSCSLSETMSCVNVTLSWSESEDGEGNAVVGYEIERSESIDGSTYGDWEDLDTVTGTSLSVSPPLILGHYYKYRVRALGDAGKDDENSAYHSAWTESSNTLLADHEDLDGFTDPVLTAGETPVRAIHMTELQSRVNQLLGWYGFDMSSFTVIIGNGSSGCTYIKDWTSHVQEIRDAIDRIGETHEDWIDITENRPSADVIQQMRDIIMEL